MIVKDVEAIIANALGSVLPYVDEAVIVDTGSTDGTIKAIADFAATIAGPRKNVYVLGYFPTTHPEGFINDPDTGRPMLVNFSAARQYGLDHCKKDYVIWLDSDDILINGEQIPSILADMEADRHEAAMIDYLYEIDEKGHVLSKLQRERIFKKSGLIRWRYPVHEVVGPLKRVKFYDGIHVQHLRHQYGISAAHRSRNIKILKHWNNREDTYFDPRMSFYLGLEEKIQGNVDESIKSFRRCIATSDVTEEKTIARVHIGKIYEEKNNLKEALSEYVAANLHEPEAPEPVLAMARIASCEQDWNKCISLTEEGFKRAGEYRGVLMYNPLDRLYYPHLFYSSALLATGQYTKTILSCNDGLRFDPICAPLLKNKELAEKELLGDHMNKPVRIMANNPLHGPVTEIPTEVLTAFTVELWKRLREKRSYASALEFIRCASEIIDDEKLKQAADIIRNDMTEVIKKTTSAKETAVDAKLETKPQTLIKTTTFDYRNKDGGSASERNQPLKIVIWTGPAWEHWCPKNLETTGIGGSETAAIHMARELTKRGHTVVMLGDHEGLENVYDGVNYTHYKRAIERPQDYACDILVCSRQPELFGFPFQYRASFLWVHDVNVGPANAKLSELFTKIDRIFCLSEWHKEFFLNCYKELTPDKVVTTSNGIDLKRFSKEPIKAGNKLIYSSSPDRGLERLMELMPAIRKEVPDVELNVYYGFENWKKMAAERGSQLDKDQVAKLEETIIEQTKSGLLKYHGRVNQNVLAAAFLQSKVWAYPTWFTETSCISAMEAQAAGCIPVTTHLAALKETVTHGYQFMPPNSSKEYGEAYVKRVVSILKDEELRLKYANAGREWAFANSGWNQVAEKWEQHFNDVLRLKETTVKAYPLAPASPAFSTPEEKTGIETSDGKRLKIAVILGFLGAPIHGVMDVENIFTSKKTMVTGTVSGFYNICWGLAERGHKVDAFCQCVRPVVSAPQYGGASFYPIETTPIDDQYDAYVSINEPDMLRTFPPTSVRACAQWLNDFSYCQEGFDDHVNVYACPSEALRTHLGKYSSVPWSKFDIIPLSVNLDFFQEHKPRRPGSMAYCSSPDRGLHHVLDMFSEIRARVPEANLRIYYRVEPWIEQVMTEPADPRRSIKGTPIWNRAKSIKESLERFKGDSGVTLVGPVPNRQIASELQETMVLAYPCDPVRFTEGFSVTVLEACAAGCVPIISAVDALPEVYGGATVMLPHPTQTRQLWIDTIVRMLTDKDAATEARITARIHARTMTRQKIAKNWEDLLKRQMEKK